MGNEIVEALNIPPLRRDDICEIVYAYLESDIQLLKGLYEFGKRYGYLYISVETIRTIRRRVKVFW
ncbi:hypothetical protein HRbin04_00592 [archaeon HR04]|nr:hypothetical protein HRbin04_00592 [archaeon HR04]